MCSYDRAGLGWSDENPNPYSIEEEVEALHRGLTTLGVKGKLILVGHSYCGSMFAEYTIEDIRKEAEIVCNRF